jgi:hypothetical protein
MVLGGYFDESVQPKGNEPICVGGWLFKPAAYGKFRRQWHRTVLRHKKHRFTHFHTTDLIAGQREYRGIDIPTRIAILDAAIDAIHQHMYGGVGVLFDQQEFERVATARWPSVFGSIYAAACQMCLEATAVWLAEWKCPMKVLYVFENGHTFEKEADAFLKDVRDSESERKRLRYRAHLFDDKLKECGLQAADLYAWTAAKVACEAEPPRSLGAFVPSLLRLVSMNAERQRVYPIRGQWLERFVRQQLKAVAEASARRVAQGPRKRAFR